MTSRSAATQAAPAGALVLRPLRTPTPRVFARVFEPRAWLRMRLATDALVLGLAASAAVFADSVVRASTANRIVAGLFFVLVLGLLNLRPSPDDRVSASLLDTGSHVLGVVSASAMVMLALDSLLGGSHPVGLALRLWTFATLYAGGTRVVLVALRRGACRTGRFCAPTLIIGAGAVAEQLASRLLSNPSYGMRPVGFLDADPPSRPAGSGDGPVPVLGSADDLAMAIAQTGARKVILAFSSEPDHALVRRIRECLEVGVEFALVPRLYEAVNERSTLDHVGGLPLLWIQPTDPRSWQFAVKHALDRGLAGAGLLLLAPLMLAIALLVRVSSPGPILFRQRRVGRDGHAFDLVKFRTMDERTGGSAASFVPPDGCAPGGVEGSDCRTRVGRLLRRSFLDELPQLANVLRGDMSLVGPRPERPEFVARFSSEVARYEDRQRVKSGMTGWAQVCGLRGQTSITDRVEWDNWYIQNWSLRLDLRIIAMTVAQVLRFRG
ncbi:MAG: exopolysaccharide biosynthesis polyprenyl glycosylphosphotransferase [Solirubrobacteraceae bacterium]